MVSLDGRSGSGKSTLVSLVAGKTDSVVKTEATSTEPAPVIFLDGVYSSGPQMADLVGLSILVDAPNEQRPTRLAKREEPGFLAQWHARWDAVEAFYFSSVRPRESFDVIVTT